MLTESRIAESRRIATSRRIAALIPARGGSKRIPRKNIRLLAGHPLMAYTLAAARQSGIFETICVSTDDEEISAIAKRYGTDSVALRRPELATDDSPDIAWIEDILSQSFMAKVDAFAILRPTNPFRSAWMIQAAWDIWQTSGQGFDSLRAVEPVKQHPCKMWLYSGVRESMMSNCNCVNVGTTPHHSQPTQNLPTMYVQNASLEIAWTKTVLQQHTISGKLVMPFFTRDYEGFDVNTELDWLVAETLLNRRLAKLPVIAVPV